MSNVQKMGSALSSICGTEQSRSRDGTDRFLSQHKSTRVYTRLVVATLPEVQTPTEIFAHPVFVDFIGGDLE